MQQMRTATWPSKDGGSETFEMVDGVARDIIEGKKVMQNNMNMGGAKVTNLGNAVNDGDALALAFAKTLFAPNGYGLGGGCTPIDTWNNALDCGFYASANGLPDGAVGYTYHGIVFKFNGNLYQLLGRTGDSETTFLLRKRTEDGSWGYWKWLNPPMKQGIVYRTAQQHNGLDVICCRTQFTLQTQSIGYFAPPATPSYKSLLGFEGCVYNKDMTYWFDIQSKEINVDVVPEGYRIQSNSIDMRNHICDITMYWAQA